MTHRLLLALLACVLQAQTPLRLLVSNGFKGTMEVLKPQAEKELGRPLNITFSSTAGLRQQIESGAAFDATVITVEAIDALARQSKLAAATRVTLAKSELGIGIRSGAPKPDIKTPGALKKTLLAAASITFPKDGASRTYLEQMFEKLGITAALKPKIILANGSTAASESVAEGKAGLVLTLFSEIIPTKGLEILGPLPGEHHYDIRFAAAASSNTTNAGEARKFIAFLASPARTEVFKSKGLDRLP
jgi:molybdate transport system substrate-binding protein